MIIILRIYRALTIIIHIAYLQCDQEIMKAETEVLVTLDIFFVYTILYDKDRLVN